MVTLFLVAHTEIKGDSSLFALGVLVKRGSGRHCTESLSCKEGML